MSTSYGTTLQEHANISNQKFLIAGKETMATDTTAVPLNPHLEHFDGITSAVMCPHTAYWHRVMSDAMIKIVNEIGFDGVYVDQVGNGEQVIIAFNCLPLLELVLKHASCPGSVIAPTQLTITLYTVVRSGRRRFTPS